jgi:hypothetical protein
LLVANLCSPISQPQWKELLIVVEANDCWNMLMEQQELDGLRKVTAS